MNCIKCNRIIPDDAHYCQYCGRDQTRKVGKRTRANGQGTVYREGKTWTAEISHRRKLIDGQSKTERIRKRGFRTKTAALEALPELAAQFAQRARRQVPTVNDLWLRYSAGPMEKLSKNTQIKYRTAFRRWAPLHDQRISDLVTADLQEVVDSATETHYPAKDMVDLMSNLYQLALPDQYVSVNLARYVAIPDAEPGEPTPYTEDEIKAFWADYGAGNKLTGYILLMIYSGMMPGELCAARKDQIDWANQRIEGAGLKTAKRRTTPIVVADFMVPVLQDLCEFSAGEKILTMNRWSFYDEFHATERRLGVRDLTPYACRHTTATALALGNIAPSVIQQVMRHAKFSTTEHYIHVDTAPQLAAVNAIAPEKL